MAIPSLVYRKLSRQELLLAYRVYNSDPFSEFYEKRFDVQPDGISLFSGLKITCSDPQIYPIEMEILIFL